MAASMTSLNGFLSITWLLLPAILVSAGKTTFNYSNPREWGELYPEFVVCSTGKQQSPIDIVDTDTAMNKTLSSLTRDYYHIDNATLINTGTAIEVKVEGYSWLKIDGKKYRLKQFHWHTPSEHRLNGAWYPAEIHKVHVASDGSLAVVAVLYEYGNPDSLLSQIQPHLGQVAEKECGDTKNVGIPLRNFDAKPLGRPPPGKDYYYYRYHGSLTTPPCTEKVTWTVLSKVQTVSKQQAAALRSPLCGVNKVNSRPEQRLHGRVVQRFHHGNRRK